VFDTFKGVTEISDQNEIKAYSKVNISDIHGNFLNATNHLKHGKE
jgi:hypothetical protein